MLPPKRSQTQASSAAVGTHQRTAHLLDVAAGVFIELGYAATTTAEVAARAKASKQSFYKRYPSKEDLFAALLEREIERVTASFVQSFAPLPTVREELSVFAETVVVGRLLSPGHVDLLRIVVSEGRRFPKIAEKFFAAGPQRGTEQLAAYLSKQTRAGRLSVKNSALAAEQFFQLVGGAMLHQALLGQHVDPRSPANKRRVQEGIDVFLSAYKKRK